jgi:DNA-binding NtrC family response regulator
MEQEASGGARTLLIVDDDESLVQLVKKMVERQGFQALIATNAAEALETYRGNRDLISLVITDLVMSGTDGRAFAKSLLQLDPDVRILVSTGLRNETDMDALRDMGVRGFVFKPYNSRDLVTSIEEALNN